MKKNKNITVKIISVFFAIILWSFVMEQENPKITKEIPNVKVELLNVEALSQSNIILSDSNNYEITVKITGRRNDIMNVTEKDVIAQADLAGYKEGEYKVPIKVAIPSKSGALEDFEPKNILIKLDSIVERQVPVKLFLEGSPKTGYVVGNYEVKQREILIRGPKSAIDLVSEARVTVKLNNETSNMNVSMPITLVDVNGVEIIKNVAKEPNVVDVSISILKTKNVSVVPDVIENPLEGYIVTSKTVNPINVKIKGTESDLANITSLKTEPININNLSKSIDIDIPVILPENVEIVDGSKNVNAIINIEKITQVSFEYSIEDISVNNLNLEYEIDKSQFENMINIEIQGIESKISQITKESIKLYIDTEGLTEGKHIVEVKIYKPVGIDILKVNPEKISIVLTKIKEEETSGEVDNSNPIDENN